MVDDVFGLASRGKSFQFHPESDFSHLQDADSDEMGHSDCLTAEASRKDGAQNRVLAGEISEFKEDV